MSTVEYKNSYALAKEIGANVTATISQKAFSAFGRDIPVDNKIY